MSDSEVYEKVIDVGRFDRAAQAEIEIRGPIAREDARAAFMRMVEERGLKLNPLNTALVVDEYSDPIHGERTVVRAEVVEVSP